LIQIDNLFIISVVSIVLAYSISSFFVQKNLLIDRKDYSKHKKLVKNSSTLTPLCGGIIIFLSSIIFFQEALLLNLFGFLILLIGLFSDNNKITSPTIRIIAQLIVLFTFVYMTSSNINDLRIEKLNQLLEIKFISIIFTTFCVLILINGSNFLDGLNTLLVGYYILVCSFLIILSKNYGLIINDNIFLLLIFLITIYLFNFFGKFYLGDSGSYLISFYMAYFMIEFSLKNNTVSPYLICLFLWYPAFENLFSILRRTKFSKKVYLPDQKHLHQMIYTSFVESKMINHKITNTFVGNLINIFNFIIFVNFYYYFNYTKVILVGIVISIFVYLILYYFLRTNKIKK
jgi:UDP-N-acetylmuramyl pentapeptide phosphotransferase/UDP-N-acetylglucosamine-1-phosphate transferase